METISRDYTTDGKYVYCQGKIIPNADPKTFKAIDNAPYFANDKNQLYALSGSSLGLQIWTDVDVESLEFFSDSAFFADKNHLFYFNYDFIEYVNHEINYETNSGVKVELQNRKPLADAWWNWKDEYYDKLEPIAHNIFSDGKRVFYHFKKGQYFDYSLFGIAHDISYHSIIPNIDKNTLQVLNDFYVKDAKTVFHFCKKISADTDTFEIINQNFAKDKNGIWYNGYLVNETIDSNTFEIISVQTGNIRYSFAKDKNSLFSTQQNTKIGKYKGYGNLLVKLKNADAETFTVINPIWAKDNNNIYIYGKIWNLIDAQSFEHLFTDAENTYISYAKDATNLYNANGKKIINGIDGHSFIALNEYWGKDKNVVFSFKTERIIKNIDQETFIITGENGEAEDQNYTLIFVAIIYDGVDFGKELKINKK